MYFSNCEYYMNPSSLGTDQLLLMKSNSADNFSSRSSPDLEEEVFLNPAAAFLQIHGIKPSCVDEYHSTVPVLFSTAAFNYANCTTTSGGGGYISQSSQFQEIPSTLDMTPIPQVQQLCPTFPSEYLVTNPSLCALVQNLNFSFRKASIIDGGGDFADFDFHRSNSTEGAAASLNSTQTEGANAATHQKSPHPTLKRKGGAAGVIGSTRLKKPRSEDHRRVDSRSDEEAIAGVKEMAYRAAALRPVSLDAATEAEGKPRRRRRNVTISSDPQTVAARLRRERVSERLSALQRLVPGGSKMDTAAMLGEAASYLRFLKSQVDLLERVGDVARRTDLSAPSIFSQCSPSTEIMQCLASSDGNPFLPPQIL